MSILEDGSYMYSKSTHLNTLSHETNHCCVLLQGFICPGSEQVYCGKISYRKLEHE